MLKKIGFGNQSWPFFTDHVTVGRSQVYSVKSLQQKVNPKLLMPAAPIGYQKRATDATMRYLLNASEYIKEAKMKIINQSIKLLVKTLAAKGYNSVYHIPGKDTNLLPDLLKNYCDDAIRDPMKQSFPFVATTYTKYNMDNTGYIKCSFTLDFVDKKGIQIIQMDVANCGMDHKPIEEWNKSISSALDIPYKDQANKKVIAIVNKRGKKKGYAI